ncbi:FtsP/CotA-like multicopper oxidase with cupredoxin domain [Murinocardiopsis flavida]|uniref:FtsP/CotA-like multicopper oxidase with cupredoxin domain n=1 Tax=Murinocardiopsis flavida TaxID=645275 RepID=A0A2P8DE17_9ACTN|nr:multicopper oxidase domain-containing protein [Murinocardiopsis flavida]PSK95464.1 FtsP/CotA-like multicopper oxidase with cupredoxin domain [Murinocardiopsis flavida]
MARSRGPVRRFLKWTAAVVAVLLAAGLGVSTWVYFAAYQTNAGDLAFENRVRIPPLLEPEVDGDGRKRFDLTLQQGRSEFLPGRQTDTWGVNGAYLGPTIRVSRGDKVAMDVRNELPDTTTVHWHGMRLPAKMDGGPHQTIGAGKTWSPYWTVDQPAASLWYHPHLHGETAKHVYRGVTGMLIVDDDTVPKDLPSEYGVDDIPLVVQDKKFTEDGRLDLDAPGPLGLQSTYGLLGDQILVNGTRDPYLEVGAERVRFRLLNGSNARSFNFGFADDRSFSLIGTDSGLLPKPVRMNRVRLSAGERAEIVADLTPGEEVVLRSFAPKEGGGFPQDRLAGADDEFDLVEIRAKDRLTEAKPLPERLADTPEITPGKDAVERDFELSGTSKINGDTMDMRRIDEVVPAGATEIWTVRNPGNPHSFHIHEVAFRVLDINGEPPPPAMRGRKDTVYLPPSATARLAVQFGPHTDPDTPYMFHCHMLEHEDQGMMGQFTIVEPGTEDQAPRRLPGGNGGGGGGDHDHH